MQRRTKREDTRIARGAAMVADKMHAVDVGAGVVPARQGIASLVRHETRPQHLSGRQSSGDNDDNDSDGQAEDGTPLRFTFDVDHTQPACRDISLRYAGGCKPYTLKAMWFYTADTAAQDPGQTTWIKISEETWKNSFNWTVIAPVSSQLLFSITDANGKTITSQDAILVRSNGLGMSIDTWCQYGYGPGGSSAFPLAPTASSHRYAWNASSNGASDNGNGQDDEPNPYSQSLDGEIASSTPTATQTQQYQGTMKTSSPASMTKITLGTVQYSRTETRTWDPNATDLNDRSTTYSKAIHDADHAKILESVLAALLALSLLALATLFFFLLKTRKRLRQARTELAAYSMVNGGGNGGSYGQHGANGRGGAMMSEKRGEGLHRSDDISAITPRANGNMRNPFDEHMQQQQQHRNSPFFLGVPGTSNANGNRMSTTSLVSAVPSHTRSTAAESAVSTEFYHTYKASTIPPKGDREGWPDMNDMMTSANTNANSTSSGTTSAAGRLRGLFGAGGPMSFFSSASSATASPAMSSTTRRSAATDSLAPTISRSSMTAGSDVTRPTSMSRNGSAETIQVPITRVSTRSDSSDANTDASSARRLSPEHTGARLTPSTASVSGRSSSGNGADESSVQGDAYDDEDVASFSNFSFVDTFSTGDNDDEETPAKRHHFSRSDTDVFSDANAVDHSSLLGRGLLQPEGGRSTPSLGGSDAYDDEEDPYAGTFRQQATSPRWSHRLSSRH